MNRQCEHTIRIFFPPIVSKQTSRPLYASYGVEKYTNASIFVHLSVGCVHLSVRPSVGPPPPLHSAAVRAANTPASHRSLCALSRAIRIHRLRCPLAVCLYYSLSTECGKVESVFCRRFSLRLHVRVYIYVHIGRSVLCCIYSESRVVCLACIAGHIPLSHPSTTHRRAHVSKATTQIHKAQTHSVNRRFFPLSLFRLPELKRRDEKFRRNAGAVFACISICVHRYCFIFVPATVCPNG